MRTIISVLGLLALAGPLYAAEPSPASSPANLDERLGVETEVLKLTSVIEPGEKIEWGDLVRIERPFGTWNLKCDFRPSMNRRNCTAQQITTAAGNALVWRIAMSIEKKPVVLFYLPPTLDVQSGLRLGFSGLEKTIIGSEWTCGPDNCTAAFAFSGFVQSAILNTADMKFRFSVKSSANDGALQDISMSAPMAGLTAALDAAATDPFGKTVPVKPVQQAQTKPVAVKPVADKREQSVVDASETASVIKKDKAEPVAKSGAGSSAGTRQKQKRKESTPTQNITPRDSLY